MKRKKLEEIRIMKEQEEEQKRKKEENNINNLINKLKLKANKEKEIEFKESSLDDEYSKHKYRLNLLNDLINQYLEIYKSKDDLNKTLEIIDKIGKIFKKEINYDKEYCKDNFIYLSDSVQSKDITINFLGILGEEFRKYGIYSLIEKKSENPILMEGVFKVVLSKYSILPKYEIKLESLSLKSQFTKKPKL